MKLEANKKKAPTPVGSGDLLGHRAATLSMLGEALVKVVRNDGEWLVLKIIDVDALVEFLQFASCPHKVKSGKPHAEHQNHRPSDRRQNQAPQKAGGKVAGAASRSPSTESSSKSYLASSHRPKPKPWKSIRRFSTLSKSGCELIHLVSYKTKWPNATR